MTYGVDWLWSQRTRAPSSLTTRRDNGALTVDVDRHAMMRGLTGVNAGPQGWLRHIVLRRSWGVGPADDRASANRSRTAAVNATFRIVPTLILVIPAPRDAGRHRRHRIRAHPRRVRAVFAADFAELGFQEQPSVTGPTRRRRRSPPHVRA